MNTQVVFIDADHVQVDGHVYKRTKTTNGRYSKEDRTRYMREYRQKLKLKSVELKI
jgi:hypothetical protein